MTVKVEKNVVNVISQNILHDRTRAEKKLILWQDDRVVSLAATLQAYPGQLDIVGIQEAYRSADQHSGEVLAEDCGYGPGFWIEHNQKPHKDSKTGRAGEHVGLFGAMVNDAELVELGDHRRAAMTVVDNVAYATFHLRAGRKARQARYGQACELVRSLKDYDNAVIFGDLNEPPIRGIALARAELARAGFRSVFFLTNQPAPATCPIPAYAPAMSRPSWLESQFVKRAWPIDDILIRGDRVRAIAAGVLERVVIEDESKVEKNSEMVPREGSDHDGVWTRLEITSAQI